VSDRRRVKRNPIEGMTCVDYKDVNLLRHFISDRGKIRSRRVTGVTPRQQRMLATAIKNAREMALLPFPSRPIR
jgi:small subunit ribosomal protein S18